MPGFAPLKGGGANPALFHNKPWRTVIKSPERVKGIIS
jgi:hypothetical protein